MNLFFNLNSLSSIKMEVRKQLIIMANPKTKLLTSDV